MDKSNELLIANLVYPIIKDLVVPKIDSVISKFSITNVKNSQIEESFEEYLTRRYEHFLIIDTLAFPNKQTLFKVLYEPLTIIEGGKYDEGEEILINDYPEEFMPKYCRVIIEDTAGMGKSTISRKLFLSIIEQNKGIPILIELRHLNSKNNILKEIQRQLSPIGKIVSQENILKIINEGDFIFLFDGFDEIANINRDIVIKELKSFIEKANNNYFLITSRAEDSLASFGDFKKFRIKDLNKAEAYSLINRYDQYSFKPIGDTLIKLLEKRDSKSLSEYLTNPLLVSLLYKSFDYKRDIPVKKTQFYQQVFDALYETHDLSKEGYLKRDKFSRLHIDDFERVLRYVGYFTAIENIVEYDKNYIINIIEKTKKLLPDLSFKSSDFLKDLLNTVPLFKQEGQCYRWSHKSLQDYFAAKFIWIDAKENRTKVLRKIYDLKDNWRFYNVLDIFYELDTNTFDTNITYWLLKDFCEYSIDNIDRFNNIQLRLRKTRIENTFSRDDILVVTKRSDYDSLISPENKKSMERSSYYNSKVMQRRGKEIESVSYHYSKNPKLIILNYHFSKSNIEPILKLLSERKPHLVLFKIPEHIHKSFVGLKEDCVYEISADIVGVPHTEEVFSLINDLTYQFYSLSHDNAFEELSRIEQIMCSEIDIISW